MEEYKVKKTFNIIGISLTIFMVLSQVVSLVLGIIINTFFSNFVESGWYIWIMSYVPLYIVSFPIFILMLKKIPNTKIDLENKIKLQFKHIIKLIVISLGIIYPLNAMVMIFSNILELFFGSGLENSLTDIIINGDFIINMIFVVIVAPIMEEIIFRYIFYKKLIKFGVKIYIFFSALFFSLFHANLYQIPYAFFIGVIFALTTYLTGSIKSSIIMHAVINFIGSGLNPLIFLYGNEILVSIWTMILIIIIISGIIMGINEWKKYKYGLNFYYKINEEKINKYSESFDEKIDDKVYIDNKVYAVRKKDIFINFGIIIYLIISLLMIMLGLL